MILDVSVFTELLNLSCHGYGLRLDHAAMHKVISMALAHTGKNARWLTGNLDPADWNMATDVLRSYSPGERAVDSTDRA